MVLRRIKALADNSQADTLWAKRHSEPSYYAQNAESISQEAPAVLISMLAQDRTDNEKENN